MLPEIEATIGAIRSVRNARYLATERGYQGAFYCTLRSELERMERLSAERILELEYQKTVGRHGTRQRPDIVFHIPMEISGAEEWKNNFAVWALKHSATSARATEDFIKFEHMCHRLCYPLAIFINVSSAETHLDKYRGSFHERVHSFAVPSARGTRIGHSYFEDGELRNVWYSLANAD
jgi:hypothetical protein